MKFQIDRKLVLQQLAWETFVVGAHAGTSEERMAILRTLCRLVESEARRPVARMNDGNSARELLPRLIGATRSVRTPYIAEGLTLGEEQLSKIEHDHPSTQILSKTILGVLLSVRVEDSWTDGDHFHWGHGIIRPESDRGEWIVASCDRLWRVATNPGLANETRRIALALLAEHHGTLNYEDLHRDPKDENPPDWTFLLRLHLERARSLAEAGELDMSLWLGLRTIWEWHADYDDDPDLKALGQECERLFRADPMRGAFAALLLDDDTTGGAIATVAVQLRTQSATSIAAFFAAGCRFLAADEHAWRRRKLEAVASAMGDTGPFSDNLREYVSGTIQQGPDDEQLTFAFELLGGYLQRLRAEGDDDTLAREVREALGDAPDDATRRTLLLRVYLETRVLVVRSIRRVECEIIAEHLSLFDLNVRLRFLGCVFAIDSDRARPFASALFDEIFVARPFTLVDALQHFCVGFHAFAIGNKTELFSQPDYEWLLDAIAHIPNPISFSRLSEMAEVVKPYPKFDLRWFAELVFKRLDRLRPLLNREREVYDPAEAVWVVTDKFPFAELVEPLRPEQSVSAESRAAIEQLLGLTSAGQSVAHYLPAVMATLDPSGVLVPELVCDRIRALNSPSWRDLAVWADYASAYALNTEPWRKIAVAVCSIANGFDTEDSERAYSHLARHRAGPWRSRPGVVAEHFTSAVEHARKLLTDEADPILKPFRAWRLKCAEADMRFQQGRLAEERRGPDEQD